LIYLDHNATTPVLPEVVEAMMPWLTANWGNPSSIHGPGRAARRAVEQARETVAALVGAEPEQVIFTSGATEANNAALHSAVFRDSAKRHVVTSVVEHSAVLTYCDYLENVHGVEVTRLPVDSNGTLNPDDLRDTIRPDTALVSLMWANNETGVIWPISELAAICAKKEVPFHSDAVQAVGKISVSFSEGGLSYLTLSGHKFGAAKGIGALIVREAESYLPFVHGGKQEGGLRGGTENVAQIVGLGEAAGLAEGRDPAIWTQISNLRDRLESEILEHIEGARVNGLGSRRLPNTTNLYLPGLDGDALLTFLDQREICISSGSACLESAITPSHVILAMTCSHDEASESVRVSFGLDSNSTDLETVVKSISEFVELMT